MPPPAASTAVDAELQELKARMEQLERMRAAEKGAPVAPPGRSYQPGPPIPSGPAAPVDSGYGNRAPILAPPGPANDRGYNGGSIGRDGGGSYRNGPPSGPVGRNDVGYGSASRAGPGGPPPRDLGPRDLAPRDAAPRNLPPRDLREPPHPQGAPYRDQRGGGPPRRSPPPRRDDRARR